MQGNQSLLNFIPIVELFSLATEEYKENWDPTYHWKIIHHLKSLEENTFFGNCRR